MRKRGRNQHSHQLGQAERAYAGRAVITRSEALAALGEVVYAVRCGDLVKIGHTGNLAARRRALKGEVLAFVPGTYDDEQAIHQRLAVHVHHGREWYHPAPAVLAVVNEMREEIGLDPVE